MKRTKRRVSDAPSFERSGHLFCDRAIATSFSLVGRLGVFICDHGEEMKLTFAMPEDAKPDEVEAAYEAAEDERQLMAMKRHGSSA